MHLPAEFFDLPEDTIHVLLVDLRRHAAALAAARTTLDADEGARAARYVAHWHGTRFASARGLLRTVMGRFVDTAPAELRFVYGPNGKPELAAVSGPRFNVSHCGDWLALGVAHSRRIGVDLERLDDGFDCLGVARQCFSAAELAELAHAPAPAESFCRLWVRKESVVKAAGRGLDAFPLFDARAPTVALPDTGGVPAVWHVEARTTEAGHHLGVASEHGAMRHRCFAL